MIYAPQDVNAAAPQRQALMQKMFTQGLAGDSATRSSDTLNRKSAMTLGLPAPLGLGQVAGHAPHPAAGPLQTPGASSFLALPAAIQQLLLKAVTPGASGTSTATSTQPKVVT